MASSTSLLHQASELNEDGIYELASGRCALALGHLEEAARLLMQCRSVGHHSSSSLTPHSTCRVQIPHLRDDLFYIYSCAVSYTPPPPPPPPSLPQAQAQAAANQTELVFALAVVLFNMALAHHQQAKIATQKQPSIAKASLRQALAYYKESQQALQSLNDTTTSSSSTSHHNHHDDDDLLLLTLAVMNNQAQILYELNDERNNAHVFQKLLTCSMHAILNSDNDNLSMVEQSQLHEFVQNAMVFRLQRPCAAPSA